MNIPVTNQQVNHPSYGAGVLKSIYSPTINTQFLVIRFTNNLIHLSKDLDNPSNPYVILDNHRINCTRPRVIKLHKLINCQFSEYINNLRRVKS